jgi:hypothetical protein
VCEPVAFAHAWGARLVLTAVSIAAAMPTTPAM